MQRLDEGHVRKWWGEVLHARGLRRRCRSDALRSGRRWSLLVLRRRPSRLAGVRKARRHRFPGFDLGFSLEMEPACFSVTARNHDSRQGDSGSLYKRSLRCFLPGFADIHAPPEWLCSGPVGGIGGVLARAVGAGGQKLTGSGRLLREATVRTFGSSPAAE